MTYRAKEQSIVKKAEFMATIDGIARRRFFWTDEISSDQRSPTRPYGGSKAGHRAFGIRPFVRGERFFSLGTA